MTPRDLAEAFLEGGRSALAVGAICAAVGLVIAVITLTGLAFRMGFMVTGAAQDLARSLHPILSALPGDIFTLNEIARFLSMLFIGIACLMGYLGTLVLVNWYVPGSVDTDGVGMAFFQTSKDILLVLTGILGSAMASVFDSRSSGGRSGDGFAPKTAADSVAE
jgi:hypothetical protein